ncbi:MAG: chemotaxis protein CheC [Armatimonadota bacterium]
MEDGLKLTDMQIDALKEVSSIASGNAATALAQLLGKRINISMPDAKVVALEDIPEVLGGLESLVDVVCVRILKDLTGYFLLICSKEEAVRLADTLIGDGHDSKGELSELGQSALKELTNIVIGCYIKAIAQIVKIKFTYTPPVYFQDMLGSIIDNILVEMGMEFDEAMAIETEFSVKTHSIKGQLLFLPTSGGLKLILEKLGM